MILKAPHTIITSEPTHQKTPRNKTKPFSIQI